ncbi:probable biopolymer transport protein [hydrothermal vent metagenome]|uniref:Probable biopolymer transport protein n=1 Tax=hydrothermal vent metagenome TaxID=652676 RepID=A0A3B1DYW3_9ZZZZ
MQKDLATKPSARDGVIPQQSLVGEIISSPIVWGIVFTFGFYALIPYLPVYRDFITRYFCSHPLEYASAGLFFIGMTILAFKGLQIHSEKTALTDAVLNEEQLYQLSDFVERSAALQKQVNNAPESFRKSCLGQRLGDIASHVQSRKSTSGLEEHLKYLAELAAERLHGSFALVRTITWAVPILGFLGTVIGITIAIANVTPEQLDSSLGNVTGGLAVAFDTTALALAMSLVIVFSSFLAERNEQNILSRVEAFGLKRIAPLFPPQAESHSVKEITQAESEAAMLLIQRTESLIDQQMTLWQETLEATRLRWTDALDGQKAQFDSALQQGISETLTNHHQLLAEVRGGFLTDFEKVSQNLLSGISNNVTSWQSQMQQNTELNIQQQVALLKQGELLSGVVEQEKELAQLQKLLTQNMNALRETETFEETIHSLTAAVHLLTARAKSKAA